MFLTSDLLLPFLVTVQGDTQAVEIGKIQKNQILTSALCLSTECKAAAALYIAATTKCFWTGETDNEPKLVSILEMWHCDISCHFTNIEITGYLWFACFTSGFLLNPTGFTKDRLLLCSSHCNWFPFFKMYVVWLSRGIEPGSCCYCKLLSLNPSMCLYQWSLCDYLDLHYIQLVHTDCMYYFIHPWMPVSNQF